MTDVIGTTPGTRVRGFVARLLGIERRIYTSIGRALTRRPAIGPGARGFRYDQPVRTILLVFIGLSAVEIPIIDLLVHPWPAVRIGFLVLGTWGLTWMIGLFCAYLVRPHTVGPDGISVRDGLEVDIPLAWDDIASVARRRTIDEPRSPRVSTVEDTRILSLRMAGHDERRDRTGTADTGHAARARSDGRHPSRLDRAPVGGRRRRVPRRGPGGHPLTALVRRG